MLRRLYLVFLLCSGTKWNSILSAYKKYLQFTTFCIVIILVINMDYTFFRLFVFGYKQICIMVVLHQFSHAHNWPKCHNLSTKRFSDIVWSERYCTVKYYTYTTVMNTGSRNTSSARFRNPPFKEVNGKCVLHCKLRVCTLTHLWLKDNNRVTHSKRESADDETFSQIYWQLQSYMHLKIHHLLININSKFSPSSLQGMWSQFISGFHLLPPAVPTRE